MVDDESGESMELMEKVQFRVSQIIGKISSWLTERIPGVDSRDERKHTGRNDLLSVEKMV